MEIYLSMEALAQFERGPKNVRDNCFTQELMMRPTRIYKKALGVQACAERRPEPVEGPVEVSVTS